MPTPTHELIASTVLSSGSGSVTFSSIPATYRDLVLVINAVTGGAAIGSTRLQFNGDTGSNYNSVRTEGTGTTADSTSIANSSTMLVGSTSIGERIMATINFANYRSSVVQKSVLMRVGSTAGSVRMVFGRWASTAAITSILVDCSTQFNSGGTFYLYGIVDA